MYEEHLCFVPLTSIEQGTQFFPLASYFLVPLLFVYFQVNNGVLYFLNYEDNGGMPPDFFFCSLFPVQQTTSGIGHRLK